VTDRAKKRILPARASALACAVIALSSPARAAEIEVGGQSVLTLATDRQTRGGGLGAALELGTPVLDDLFLQGSELIVRGRASALIGAGLAWGVELGTAWRPPAMRRWQPDLGIYALVLGGALIRAVDDHGHEANDPIAVEFGLTPLRFRLDEGWVSLLAVRAGPTLGTGGASPYVFSVTLVEVGRRFELW
jgi:hypothetical protein